MNRYRSWDHLATGNKYPTLELSTASSRNMNMNRYRNWDPLARGNRYPTLELSTGRSRNMNRCKSWDHQATG